MLLVIVMLMGTFSALILSISAESESGLSFADQTVLYKGDKALEEGDVPVTIEAWVKIPTAQTGRAGVIIGNYGAGDPCFALEVWSGKVSSTSYTAIPRLFWQVDSNASNKVLGDIMFTDVKMNTGEWIHLVISRDTANQKVLCYVNGVLKQEVAATGSWNGSDRADAMNDNMTNKNAICIGGDLRSGNGQNFKGEIKGVSMYNDMLSGTQIASNYSASKSANIDSLICRYEMSSATTNVIEDLSGNGYTVRRTGSSIFERDYFYQAEKAVDITPNSFEAWIKLPKDYASRPGIILGTYGNSSSPGINFEINTGGVPRLYWTNNKGAAQDLSFSGVNVCTGDWVHLVITRDVLAGKAYCYVNGAFKEELSLNDTGKADNICTEPFIVGGDYRINSSDVPNEQYFKGEIKAVAVYSKSLHSENDILVNYTNGAPSADATNYDSMMFYYDLSVGNNTIADKTGNGYNLNKVSADVYINADHPEKEEIKDFDYTFAVVGDTQSIVVKKPGNLHYVYDWLINNKESEKLAFVMGVGDITDTTTGVESEWQEAMGQILRLEAADIPFSIVRGNHDSESHFNKYYPYDEYKDTVSGAYNGSMANTYQKFTIGNRKFLVLALDCGPTDDMLSWAESVIEAHPEHNVIITTHSYLYRDGTTHDSDDLWPVANNNGEDLWQELVRKHSNIRLVLNGHDPVSKIITNQTAGDNGNIVTSMLIDGQYDDSNNIANGGQGVGLVALLHFSEDSDEIQVEYVSTVKNKYYRPCNQFSITLDLMEFEECDHNFKDGYCTECEEWDGETAVLLGANVALSNNIKVNYYAKLPEAYKTAQMKFTRNGKETLVDAIYLEKEDQYMFVFDNIPPQCMGDNIKAELIFDGVILTEKDEYSILQNAKNILQKHSGEPKTVNLVKSMLNYGAAAQKYTGYKTETLVNEGYTMVSVVPNEDVSVKNVENNIGDAIFTAAGVHFDSVNRLYVKITADTKPTVTVNGAEALVKENGEGEWKVYTDGIFVIDFDTPYTFVITSNTNLPTITYSVNSYTYAKLTSDNEVMVELAKATYTYGIAAEEYSNTNPSFNGDSLNFTESKIYKQNKPLEKTPNTVEAWIYLPEIKRSVIYGNYGGTGAGINFEINANGCPRLYWMTGSGSPNDLTFINTIVPTKEWVHIVITRDKSTGTAKCYINGVLKETLELNNVGMTDLPTMTTPHAIGADLRSGNTYYFKGSIKSVAVYSDCLTATQIASNYSEQKPTERASLICYYYLAFMADTDTSITDFSGNGYTITK